MSLGGASKSSRIHVLGAGAVGLLFAAHLRQSGHPITLVLRSQAAVDRFRSNGGRIAVVNEWVRAHPSRRLLLADNTGEQLAPWFAQDVQAEVAYQQQQQHQQHQKLQLHMQRAYAGAQDAVHYESNTEPESGTIRQLILATKAQDTLEAYWSVKQRLNAQSTVVLLQNGMGVYEAIQREFYNSPQQQSASDPTLDTPAFIIGTNSHGCLRDTADQDSYLTRHTAMGCCQFAIRPSLLSPPPALPQSALDMLNALAALSLDARIVNWSDLHQALLLKLAANATINPVTALADCRNGYLVPPSPENTGLGRCVDQAHYKAMDSLRASACAEIAAIYARAHPHLHHELTAQALGEYVAHVARTTAMNRSSMLQDVSAGRQTEVDWINGYLVRLGQQHG
ncbi:2-dehydropantoate 2-reductase (Ketopantoate reductase) (KPA reductase) (KPR), partial [Coemansia sp. Benny D115]